MLEENAFTSPVLTEMRGAVLWIMINRDERRNALNEEVVLQIDRAIASAGLNPDCRAIVLTGAGARAFCAGADLQKGVQGGAFEVDFSQHRHYLVALFHRMRACRVPLIARVNGHVMAGGIGILCACDMAITCDDVLFGTPESKIGVVPMMILPGMLRIIPERKLLEMCITGEPFQAFEALSMGLVNYVVPRAELNGKVDWLLSRILDKSPTSIRLGKQAFHAMRDMSVDAALDYAQVMVPSMVSTQDAREGIASFQEKRKPVWTGK